MRVLAAFLALAFTMLASLPAQAMKKIGRAHV